MDRGGRTSPVGVRARWRRERSAEMEVLVTIVG
jgi:hypothetical protein